MEIKKKNNSGATLIELMVYMIVGLIVITAAFQSIARGTRGYQHGRQVSRVQGDARTGVATIARDIASMGFKTHIEMDNNVTPPRPVARISDFGYTDIAGIVGTANVATPPLPESQAAFFFRPSIAGVDGATGFGDTLEFFRIRVNPAGTLEARERIVYFLDETRNQIVRSLQIWTPSAVTGNPVIPGAWGAATETVIVSNAVAMKFRLGRDGTWTWPATTTPPAPADAWITSNLPGGMIPPARNQVRHVEVSILVRAETESNAPHGVGIYNVGDISYTPPPAFNNRIHRLYRQTVEVPNNARPPR